MGDFWSVPVARRARKPHLCSICYRRIDPGETYRYQTGNYDGHFYTGRFCAHCDAVWTLYRPEDMEGLMGEEGYDTWQSGGTYPPLKDELDRIRELRARVNYRRRWRRKDGTLVDVPA